jgi:hypothetical protein
MDTGVSQDLTALTAAVRDLPPALRLRIAEGWLDAALDEHASIAAFSRFSLHLLAVGAPPELLAGAHQAALDEIGHARVCFDIAGVYAGEAVGPGPLVIPPDLLGPLDLGSIAAAAVAEGCVGETIAALEARTLARLAAPPAVQETLRRIADEEQQHASLSWRFAGWALSAGGEEVRAAMKRAFADTADADAGPAPTPSELDDTLHSHGLASPTLRHNTRTAALADVIQPAREALFAGSVALPAD